jgi:hypothetical protein
MGARKMRFPGTPVQTDSMDKHRDSHRNRKFGFQLVAEAPEGWILSTQSLNKKCSDAHRADVEP